MANVGDKEDEPTLETHSKEYNATGPPVQAFLVEEDAKSHPHGERPTLWMWVLTFASGISGLLFGYDTGVISGALVVIGTDLGQALSDQQKEFITAATSLGALLASIPSGVLADLIGRKWVIAVADAVFITGAVIQAVAGEVWIMIVGRFIVGVGVGLASLIVPLYLAELSPAPFRGRMVVVNNLFVTFGQVVAYAIGAGLEHTKSGWRIMVGIGAIPAGLQLLSIFGLPESPRFLIRKGKNGKAKQVLSKIYKDEDDSELEKKVIHIEDIINKDLGLRREHRNSKFQVWLKNLKELYTIGSNFRALIISCGLQGIQQLCGFNSLMYFSATIFKMVGFKNSIAVSMIVAGTNFIMTCVAFSIIDKVGRRRILVGTIWGMSAGLSICAIAFHFLPRDSAGVIVATGSNKWAIVILISQIIYVIFYATGIGSVPWLSQSEIFAYNVRGLGTGMATATCWAGNLLIGSTFLTMVDTMTPSGTFGFYACICFLGWLFVIFLYPDLSGFTLEEVGEILGAGFGIKESERKRKELKRSSKGERRRREGVLTDDT